MVDEEQTFEETLAGIVETATAFKAEHGSCEIVVGPNSPLVAARIERLAGVPVVMDHITLIGRDRSTPDIKVDGSLTYFRAVENDDVTIKEAVRSVDWLGGFDEIDWNSADYSDTGVYLEGDKGDTKIAMRMVVSEFTTFVEPDWSDDDEDDDG